MKSPLLVSRSWVNDMLSEEEKSDLRQRLNELEKSEQTLKPKEAEKSPYRFIHLGLEFSFTIGLCLVAGYWLDNRWNTSPWLLLTGLCSGFAAALYRLIKASEETES